VGGAGAVGVAGVFEEVGGDAGYVVVELGRLLLADIVLWRCFSLVIWGEDMWACSHVFAMGSLEGHAGIEVEEIMYITQDSNSEHSPL
jgi:hypothetical protein